MDSFQFRPADQSDLAHIQRILYEAATWDSKNPPPIETVLDHPELARYHQGWGREGDLGVLVATDGEVVGGAVCRLFTEDDRGYGFVDEQTPELGIALWSGYRRKGLGGRLLERLASAALAAGVEQLSLSVNVGNPAVALYERHGYRKLSEDEASYLMLKQLG